MSKQKVRLGKGIAQLIKETNIESLTYEHGGSRVVLTGSVRSLRLMIKKVVKAHGDAIRNIKLGQHAAPRMWFTK